MEAQPGPVGCHPRGRQLRGITGAQPRKPSPPRQLRGGSWVWGGDRAGWHGSGGKAGATGPEGRVAEVEPFGHPLPRHRPARALWGRKLQPAPQGSRLPLPDPERERHQPHSHPCATSWPVRFWKSPTCPSICPCSPGKGQVWTMPSLFSPANKAAVFAGKVLQANDTGRRPHCLGFLIGWL